MKERASALGGCWKVQSIRPPWREALWTQVPTAGSASRSAQALQGLPGRTGSPPMHSNLSPAVPGTKPSHRTRKSSRQTRCRGTHKGLSGRRPGLTGCGRAVGHSRESTEPENMARRPKHLGRPGYPKIIGVMRTLLRQGICRAARLKKSRTHSSVHRIEAAADPDGTFAIVRMAPCFPGVREDSYRRGGSSECSSLAPAAVAAKAVWAGLVWAPRPAPASCSCCSTVSDRLAVSRCGRGWRRPVRRLSGSPCRFGVAQ